MRKLQGVIVGLVGLLLVITACGEIVSPKATQTPKTTVTASPTASLTPTPTPIPTPTPTPQPTATPTPTAVPTASGPVLNVTGVMTAQFVGSQPGFAGQPCGHQASDTLLMQAAWEASWQGTNYSFSLTVGHYKDPGTYTVGVANFTGFEFGPIVTTTNPDGTKTLVVQNQYGAVSGTITVNSDGRSGTLNVALGDSSKQAGTASSPIIGAASGSWGCS